MCVYLYKIFFCVAYTERIGDIYKYNIMYQFLRNMCNIILALPLNFVFSLLLFFMKCRFKMKYKSYVFITYEQHYNNKLSMCTLLIILNS